MSEIGMRDLELDGCYKEIDKQRATIASLQSEVRMLNDERMRDALDGQAALDEANNEIAALRARCEAAEEENAKLLKENSAQGNELDALRKVVWSLERKPSYYAWAVSYDTEKHNNLDIAALQKGMGK